jgi:NADPH:quinone reductase-like Zn-dependent oxidoreductase
MKALVVDTFTATGAAQVTDIADPPRGNDVLIEVRAAGLGFPDALIAQLRAGIR